MLNVDSLIHFLKIISVLLCSLENVKVSTYIVQYIWKVTIYLPWYERSMINSKKSKFNFLIAFIFQADQWSTFPAAITMWLWAILSHSPVQSVHPPVWQRCPGSSPQTPIIRYKSRALVSNTLCPGPAVNTISLSARPLPPTPEFTSVGPRTPSTRALTRPGLMSQEVSVWKMKNWSYQKISFCISQLHEITNMKSHFLEVSLRDNFSRPLFLFSKCPVVYIFP